MGELTLWDKVREWIGSIGWRVFLWGSKRTEEEYYAIMRESYENESDAAGECLLDRGMGK